MREFLFQISGFNGREKGESQLLVGLTGLYLGLTGVAHTPIIWMFWQPEAA